MKCTEYRGFIIDWIEHKDTFRIYRPERERETIAYADTIEEAKTGIDDNAWRWEGSGDWKQWIADVYHCSDPWGQTMTAEDMRIMLEEIQNQKDANDYSPDPSLAADCAAYWNDLCMRHPN